MSIKHISQPSFEDLGTHLAEVTFCVVDLETTGGSAESCITEIGAVKVQGGQVLGEFQTLVRPHTEIPALIQSLTGITTAMVANAPELADAIEAFATFSAGSVLVAHNARFDVGFLRRAYEQVGISWPRPQVLDTVTLARNVLIQGEVRNVKLATLAEHFHASVTPNHRALSDARATVEVLHGLLERVGNLGVATLEDLVELLGKVSPARRAKRIWADDVPSAPGVYWFEHASRGTSGDPRCDVLYVGKSSNLKRRVRNYFTAAEGRKHIHEMVQVATAVKFVTCATGLEAEVRELRMIDQHAPRYNRASRNQGALSWLKLTAETFPRLSVVRRVTDPDALYWGPFTKASDAAEAAITLQQACGIRPCTTRLSATKASPACMQAELGRCSAPCQLGSGATSYGQSVALLHQVWLEDARPVLRSARLRLQDLITQERFEEAGQVAGRLRTVHQVARRFHRLRALSGCPELVAAAPASGGWDIHVIRYGKLAGAQQAPTQQVRACAQQLADVSETVLPPAAQMPAGTVAEAERIAAWLETPGVRLLSSRGDWAWPVHGCVADVALADELLGQIRQP